MLQDHNLCQYRHKMAKNSSLYLTALGGNLTSSAGSPAETLAAALIALPTSAGRIRAVSRFFQTPAFPPGAGPDYVNAAAIIQSDLEPAALLAELHRIEAMFARERRERWGQRTLDLDLLARGDTVLPDVETFAAWHDLPPEKQRHAAPDRLILPHPRLHERGFVLIPLNDIAPHWVHPVLNCTVSEMCGALPDDARKGVEPIRFSACL